jgi:DNA-3-methyladenine glycosylase
VSPSQRGAILPVDFFRRPTQEVARALLGSLVVSRVGGTTVTGRIVETEAYLGENDPASHGYLLRRTPRNKALFGPPGNWYVYLSYGVHWCANLVCEGDGSGAAVLIRALEPVEGIDVMRRRRKVGTDRGLCSGPGKLCQALAITRRLDGKQMVRAEVTVLRDQRVKPANVLVTPRVGITKAADWPLRFTVASSPWVSG